MPLVRSPLRGRAVSALLLASSACLLTAPAEARSRIAPVETPIYAPADTLEGNFLAAQVAVSARDTAAAASYYREALKADPRNAELLERAFVAFLAEGSMQEAFRIAERLAQRDQVNGLANLALGVRQLKQKQWAGARATLAKGGKSRAADLTSTLLTAWAHAGAGDGKKALETVDKLANERFYNVFRDYHAGLIADLVGNDTEAEKRLKAAYESERNTLRIVDAYGRLESKRGRRDAALAAYAKFEEVLSRHPLITAAVDQLKAGTPLPPLVGSAQEGAAEVLYGLGAAAGSSPGEELPSIVYLRLALHLNPDHSLAILTLADTFERIKRLDRANEIFSRMPEGSPLRSNSEIQIGLNLEQLGKGEEALKHLEALMQERPDDVEVITALGNVQRSRKRWAEAAETYSKAIEKIGTPDRSRWSLFYFRGSAYERAKEWAKAEADLKKALELIPEAQRGGRAQVLNYLAYSWVDTNQNIDEAFKMLKQAVELSPRDGMIIDSLGWAYYRLGHYEDAVRELEKAVELKPGDPVINDHLGDAYWKVGRRLEATFQWQHAKEANPEPEDLAKILVKLERGLDEEKPKAAGTESVEAPKNGG